MLNLRRSACNTFPLRIRGRVNCEQNNTLGSAVKEKAKRERNPTATQWMFVQRETPKLNQDTFMIFPLRLFCGVRQKNRAIQTEPFPSVKAEAELRKDSRRE